MLASSATPHLNYHDLDNVLTPPETEHNWAAKEAAIKTLGAACQSSIAQNHDYIHFIKNHRKSFTESLLTERTRLSGVACELVEKLATAMGRDFVLHFADFFTGALIKVCARTNKVMVSRAVKALNSIISVGTVVLLPKACQAFSTPNKALRIACIGLIASCITQFSTQELDPFLSSFEPVLKEGVQDAAPEVRDTSRKSFKTYALKFPERSSAMTSTLPQAVLKYLLPDSRPTTPVRAMSTRPMPAGRLADAGDLPRHQSSRELTPGQTRVGLSRIGPVRARTMAAPEQSPSATFKSLGTNHQSSTSSMQPYAYHSTQSHNGISNTSSSQRPFQQQHPQYASQHHDQNLQYSQQQQQQQQQQQPHVLRHHGPPSRTGTTSSEHSDAGHGAMRLASQRSRALSSNSMTTSSMIQRSPSINLAVSGGAQRIVSSGPYSADAAKPTRPSTLSHRLSKAEPITKSSRISAISTQGGNSMDREPTTASERAKAYSASLKNEMANRRAQDPNLRASTSVKRITTDHNGYSSYSSMASASSTTSGSSVSAATSTTSVSSGSSTSTSPTALNSPLHDQLFSTFRTPSTSLPGASSSVESVNLLEPEHSSPPTSKHTEKQTAGQPEMEFLTSQEATADSMHSSAEALTLQSRAASSPPSSAGPVSTPPPSNDAVHGQSDCIQPTVVDQHDFMEAADEDHHMSIPDHESLFGRTENYLQIEQEIHELQRGVPDLDTYGPGADKFAYMDEDSHPDEQEELAVKAYAELYETTLQVNSSPPHTAVSPKSGAE